MTPIISAHALDRCREMGISTKVAKHIVQQATLTRPDHAGSIRRVAQSSAYPEYVVVYEPGVPDVVVTVLFNAQDFQERDGVGYVRQGKA